MIYRKRGEKVKINSIKVKLLSAESGLTVEQLAKSSGVAFATIVKARNGGNVSAATLVKLARALGVKPEELLEESEKEGET